MIHNLTYFELFPLLDELESIRKGIKDRVWNHINEERDIQFKPINNRISFINLFYFGIGNEFYTEYLNKYPEELEHSKNIFPDSFIENSKQMNLRLDFNLILSTYESYINDIESFPILIKY